MQVSGQDYTATPLSLDEKQGQPAVISWRLMNLNCNNVPVGNEGQRKNAIGSCQTLRTVKIAKSSHCAEISNLFSRRPRTPVWWQKYSCSLNSPGRCDTVSIAHSGLQWVLILPCMCSQWWTRVVHHMYYYIVHLVAEGAIWSCRSVSWS